jgi:phage baseplate assembly protein V
MLNTHSELMRLICNLVRIGQVFAIDTERARLRVRDGAGFESAWLPWGVARAGEDITWRPYSVGEQVVIVCPNGDPAQAIVLCSLYSNAGQNPKHGLDKTTHAFSDGGFFQYDTATGTLTIHCSKIKINADIEVNGQIESTGDQIAGGISQINHVHIEQGDGKPVSKPQ